MPQQVHGRAAGGRHGLFHVEDLAVQPEFHHGAFGRYDHLIQLLAVGPQHHVTHGEDVLDLAEGHAAVLGLVAEETHLQAVVAQRQFADVEPAVDVSRHAGHHIPAHGVHYHVGETQWLVRGRVDQFTGHDTGPRTAGLGR